jgi:chromosome segregation ATPase
VTTGSGERAAAEALAWLEEQIVALKEAQTTQMLHTEQLQRQVHEVADQTTQAQVEVRQIDPKIAPYTGIPEKLISVNEDAERLRAAVTSNKNDIDTALRTLQAEANNSSQDRGAILKRVEAAAAEVAALMSTVAQAQAQVGQMAQTITLILERQATVESDTEQFGLRLERSIEVTHGLEARIADRLNADQEERLSPVFERMQLLGEMIRRVEGRITELAAEQTLREDVLQEISAWRDQHGRLEVRLNELEEGIDKLFGETDKIRGDVSLAEGRHAGMNDRVAGMRRDISVVVDQVRDEFSTFSTMLEKQRRKQIQTLEQELRETKFHAFHPPEEP